MPFYALGRYDRKTHAFRLLDNRSDLGNNVFDGGEGYAHMNVLDPRPSPGHPHGRMLWTGAVIEGARCQPFNFTPMGVNSVSSGSPHVRCTPMCALSTCGA